MPNTPKENQLIFHHRLAGYFLDIGILTVMLLIMIHVGTVPSNADK